MADYWKKRQDLLYYKAVDKIVKRVGKKATSLIDVGSHNTTYIDKFHWIADRAQLDIVNHNVFIPGVRFIEADFFNWEPDKKYDLGLCMQVLEHIPDAEAFADKLKQTASKLVVSVPYLWENGKCKEHVHDPVDEEKLFSWMKIEPSYSMIVTEPFGVSRMIAYYENL